MSGRIVKATASAVATTTSTKTLIMGKPTAGGGGRLLEASISYNGVTASHVPHLVRVRKATTDGTGTAVTEVKLNEFGATPDIDCFKNFTVEPTKGDILDEQYVSPNNGFYVWNFTAVGGVVLAQNERVIIEVDTPANDTNACVNMMFEV